MRLFFLINILLQAGLGMGITKRHPLFRRQVSQLPGQIQCIQLVKNPGQYWYIAGETNTGCALFLLGGHETRLEIEFLDFNIDCESDGLLSIIDGWEMNYELFPSLEDLPRDINKYRYCGLKRPRRKFVSSQNAALINYYTPKKGQGFSIRVKFISNPFPCNVISIENSGTYTLRNYGLRMNCSISIIYPEVVNVLSVNIGTTSTGNSIDFLQRPSWHHRSNEIGKVRKTPSMKFSSQCMTQNGGNYFELKTGDGLDPKYMIHRTKTMCGNFQRQYRPGVLLGCGNSVVRMVSNGDYYNSVTFSYQPATEEEINSLHYGYC